MHWTPQPIASSLAGEPAVRHHRVDCNVCCILDTKGKHADSPTPTTAPMPHMPSVQLETRKHWEGSADDLVNEIAAILDTTVPEQERQPNVRLLRHYQTVGAVSRPERRGKQAVYRYRHLLETLVTRQLVTSGWPLRKIAEITGAASEDELEAMLTLDQPRDAPASTPGNHAQELVRRFAQEAASAEPASAHGSRARSGIGSAGDAGGASRPHPSSTEWRSTLELRLPFSARLTIDADRLAHLAPEEIHQLARALERGLRDVQRHQQKRSSK